MLTRSLAAIAGRSFNAQVGQVLRYKWAQCPESPASIPRRLLVEGLREAVDQIIRASGWRCVEEPVPRAFARSYSYSLKFNAGEYTAATELAELLRHVLTMRCPANLDHALALDWTKVREQDSEPRAWPRTHTGTLVHFGKNCNDHRALNDLASDLAAVIAQHPSLRIANAIVTVPGSRADGDGFAERLARHVAERTQIRFSPTISVIGPRRPMKAASAEIPSGAFTIQADLHGSVLVIDDVYRTGRSMSEAARAARQAGASHVFGLAAVRTLRN